MGAALKAAKPRTMGDVLRRLGVSADRVRVDVSPGRATVRDLLRVNEEGNVLCELIDGYLVEKVMGYQEAYIGGELFAEIREYLRDHDLGIVTPSDGSMRIGPGLVRLPDVAFVAWEQLPDGVVPSTPVPSLYPDLAVEILSISNTKAEIRRKLREYFTAGTRLAWVIDPRRREARVYASATEYELVKESGVLEGGEVLPGFRMKLSELFSKLGKRKKK
jgi:Uma2 family endonuclease